MVQRQNKNRQADRERVDAMKEPLSQLVATLDKLRANYLPNYVLLAAMQPYLFHASLLSELNKIVEQISRERNVVLISEFNRRIASIVLTEPVPFLYERLGEKYEHILIDEFQDTSVLQWNNLLPLVENTLANGHSSLAVGDAKQAIYRWRGGEMEQILRLHQRQHGGAGGAGPRAGDARAAAPALRGVSGEAWSRKALQVNYRSAREIIDFNNAFFKAVSERHESLGLVTGIFDEHFGQQVPESQRADQQGHVELLFTQKDAPALLYDVPQPALTPPSPSPAMLPKRCWATMRAPATSPYSWWSRPCATAMNCRIFRCCAARATPVKSLPSS
jgi:ATP-dependent helicase/nuclease subunit A